MEKINYFQKLFYPKSIAFIGASDKRIWQVQGYVDRGYPGKFYIVSKRSEKIFDIKCLKDVSELPDGIDLAIIAIVRDQLVDVVKQCIEKNFYRFEKSKR